MISAPVPADRFTAQAVRQGPLTWSQQFFWFDHHWLTFPHRRVLLLRYTWDPPAGTSLAALGAALDALVLRHEALRTRYGVGADGQPVQVVLPPEPVSVITCPTGNSADEAALITRMRERDLDIGGDPPIRVGVLTDSEGYADRVIVMVHHFSVDLGGLDAMVAELEQLSAGAAGFAARPAWQPLDQAAAEQSARGRVRAKRTRLYWENLYSRMPYQTFPDRKRGPFPQRYHLLGLRCDDVEGAVRDVANRYQSSPASVYLAAFGAFLSLVSGQRSCAVTVAASNRITAPSAKAVGCLFQPVMLCLDVDLDRTFADLVARAGAANLTAQLNGAYSYFERKQAEARCAHRRGVSFRSAVDFNYVENKTPRAPSPGEAVPVSGEVYRRPAAFTDDSCDLYLWVYTHPSRTDIMLMGHAAVISAATIEHILVGMRELIMSARDEDTVPLSGLRRLVEAKSYGPGWAFVDNCWIRPDDVRAVLLAHPGVRAAAVVVDDDGLLTAYIHGADGTLGPSTLRQHVIEHLAGGSAVIAPHRYVLCAQAPDDPDDPRAWAAQPVLPAVRGDGPTTAEPSEAAAQALCAAVEKFNPGVEVDSSAVYLLAGGRAGVLTALLVHLHDQGYTGLSPSDLAGPASLGSLAKRLRPVGRG
ncbi:condensation domain-containing protein [Micromonospora pallida]|nr:condensation domain-containing protein [Micromonospora pallida]